MIWCVPFHVGSMQRGRRCALYLIAVLALSVVAMSSEAAITRVGVTSTTTVGGSSASSIDVAVPAGVVAGDVLLAQVAVRGGSGTTISSPSGWTQLLLDNSGSTIRQGIYYRIAGATEPASYTFTFSSSQRAAGGMVAYRGVDNASPINASLSQDAGSGTSVVAAAITTDASDAQVAGFFSTARATSFTSVTDTDATVVYAERYDQATAAGTNGVTVMMADGSPPKPNAGSTGNVTGAAADSAAHIGALVALKPAALLRADYHFDECQYSGAAGEVLDSSGNALHATARNGFTTSQPGQVQRMGNLDTYDKWAQTSITMTRDWSVSVWFETPFATTGASQYYIIASMAGGGDLLYLDRASNYRWGVYTTAGTTDGSFRFGTLANGWHHMVLVGRGTKTYLYLDGSLRDNVTRKTSGTLTYLGTSFDYVNTVNAQGFRAPVDEFMLWDNALGSSQISAIYANQSAGNNWDGTARAPAACFDHFQIAHSGTGVNCQPENVTFTAHGGTHAAATLPAGTVINITTSTNHGDWSLVAGGGILTNSGNGAASYVSGAESSFVLGLRDTYAETVNINVNAGGVTERTGTASGEAPPGSDPDLVFAAAGFRFVDGAGNPIGTQISGRVSSAYYLQAIRSSACATPGACAGACTGVFADGANVNIQLASECTNPTTCQAGQQVSVTNNGVTSAIAANNAGAVSSYATRAMRFGASSQAPFTFSYADAGQIRLHARYALDATNTLSGASNPFVVRPFGFRVAVPGNPAAADATGAKFRKAGENFSASVTAVVWQAADDLDNDGVPDPTADLSDNSPTPNFGNEVAPEAVTLAQTLVAPSAGNAGTLSGGIGLTGFSGGTRTATLSYSEAGVIRLNAALSDGDYIGSGGNITGTSVNVGRFYPDHFTLTPAAITNRSDVAACTDGFTYLDEPFRLNFTLEARNTAGVITQNYKNDALPSQNFAKLDLTLPASFNYAALNGAALLTARLDLAAASSGTWAAGQGMVQAPIALRRAAAPDGPYTTLGVGIAPQDADGVQLSPASLDMNADGAPGNDHARVGVTELRFGRLRLSNAYGSERLPLPVSLRAQHWNGTGFVDSGTDQCTRVNASDIALTFPIDPRNQLAACETRISLPVLAPGAIFNGNALALTAPGAGNQGWTNLRVNLGAASGSTCVGAAPTPATSANMVYLRGNWGGAPAYDQDPVALAAFGIYRGAGQFIYFRENHF